MPLIAVVRMNGKPSALAIASFLRVAKPSARDAEYDWRSVLSVGAVSQLGLEPHANPAYVVLAPGVDDLGGLQAHMRCSYQSPTAPMITLVT